MWICNNYFYIQPKVLLAMPISKKYEKEYADRFWYKIQSQLTAKLLNGENYTCIYLIFCPDIEASFCA
jgi:hypothetical protein